MAASYPDFLFTIIFNTAVILLGAVVAVGTPYLLIQKLGDISGRKAANALIPAPDPNAPPPGPDDVDSWDEIAGGTLSVTATAYLGSSYYFFVNDFSRSVTTSIFKGTSLVVAGSVTIGAVVAVAVLLDKKYDVFGSGQDAANPSGSAKKND